MLLELTLFLHEAADGGNIGIDLETSTQKWKGKRSVDRLKISDIPVELTKVLCYRFLKNEVIRKINPR